MSPSLLLFILTVSKIYLFISMHSVCVCDVLLYFVSSVYCLYLN